MCFVSGTSWSSDQKSTPFICKAELSEDPLPNNSETDHIGADCIHHKLPSEFPELTGIKKIKYCISKKSPSCTSKLDYPLNSFLESNDIEPEKFNIECICERNLCDSCQRQRTGTLSKSTTFDRTQSKLKAKRRVSITNRSEKKKSSLLRSTSSIKALKDKQRMIKMIGVVVLEFFICWTPLYVLNTVALFDPALVYGFLGMKGVAAVHLLAYCSACCNPITYSFMSKSFRTAFLNVIQCKKSSTSRYSDNMT